MESWSRVKWSEAAQVVRLLAWPEEEIATPVAGAPQDYFGALRKAGQLREACYFIAQALPRLEGVAWGARCVRDLRAAPLHGPAAEALKATLLWVQDPSEPRRRASYEAALMAPSDCAERLVAMAAFFSGGSIAPAELQPVQPPKDVAGRLAAGAVVAACARSSDMIAALARCLDAGDAMAVRGLAAAA